jgi:signal transduction histidine kinase
LTPASSPPPLRVLLVDDEAAWFTLLDTALRTSFPSAGIEWASTAARGLDRLVNGVFDVCLLDHVMPDSDGLQLLREARLRGSLTPVIILTGHETENLDRDAVAAGASDCLGKSEVDAVRLVRVVRYAVERRQLEQQLQLAQKMEAIGRLAGGIAHDFNNLLTVILGYCETLTDDLRGQEGPLQDLAEINKAAERAAHLTQQLLAFSRRQILQPEIVDLNRIVGETEGMLQSLVGDRITLETILAPDLGAVEADRDQLQQVLVNLVLNARDAMPDGGLLTIETRNLGPDGGIDGRPATPAIPSVMLAVSDTGIGFDSETKGHLFEPFFTTKGRRGSGLGLATVYGIVKQSGGEVSASGEPGRGASFRVLLPRVDGQGGRRG